MSTPPPGYTRLPVPGLPGVHFRDLPLDLGPGRLRILSASAVDVLEAAPANAIPYWAVAWPAGLGLARYLAGRPLKGQPLLELGAGVGVSALGAALAGAEVTVTDNQPPALRLAAMNARRNDLRLRLVGADWRAWPLRLRYPRVIGSDVTYEPEAFGPLLAVLQESLAPGGEVLLADPGRLTASVFQQRAQRAGWTWETRELPPEGRHAVFLYRLRRHHV
jgi:predicted nicotinamide N-methyase